MKEFIVLAQQCRKLWIWQIPFNILMIVLGIAFAFAFAITPFVCIPFIMSMFFYEIYMVYKEIKCYLSVDGAMVKFDSSTQDVFAKMKKCMGINIFCKAGLLILPISGIFALVSLILKIIFCSKLKDLKMLVNWEDEQGE